MNDPAAAKSSDSIERLHEIAILMMTVLAAITYGVIHDQITVRICLEYFTVFHELPFESDSPTVIALLMGILATWWVGLPLGVGLMLASRAGSLPKRSAISLIRPLATLLVLMGIGAAVAGFAGYHFASKGQVVPPGDFAQLILKSRHPVFVADFWAHNASYAGGVIGGLGLIFWVLWSRYRMNLRQIESVVQIM